MNNRDNTDYSRLYYHTATFDGAVDILEKNPEKKCFLIKPSSRENWEVFVCKINGVIGFNLIEFDGNVYTVRFERQLSLKPNPINTAGYYTSCYSSLNEAVSALLMYYEKNGHKLKGIDPIKVQCEVLKETERSAYVNMNNNNYIGLFSPTTPQTNPSDESQENKVKATM